MRTPLNSPFTPGSDTVPQVWAGRMAQLADWERVVRPRLLAGLPERGRTVLGEAGLGKSSLVRLIAADADQRGDWVTPQLRIPSGADSLKAVSSAILALADRAGLPLSREKRIKDLVGRVRTVAVQGMSLTIDRSAGPEPYTALYQLLIEVGLAAMRAGQVALIHIDEVQNITDGKELSQLLIALGDAITHEETVVAPGGIQIRRALPISVYLTGLPDFADLAGSRTGATFARRFATTVLAPIDDDDLTLSLQPFVTEGWEVPTETGGTERIWMEQEAAAQIVSLCHGEPFLFQLAGERAWYAGSSPVISVEDVLDGWQQAATEASLHVERILERLPVRERRFVEAMTALDAPDRTLTKIAKTMGLADASQVGTAAQRLDTVRGIIDRGRPYTFRHRAVEAYLTTNWPRL